ncbi:DUF3040 domain-containing protein [Amycolatopsis sp. NPDC059027]|uniref:DUF3040 domain-containing protein n=1 Tax=unclassified Amycolatopsis TaxID=2618356 RepID=UPI0036731211
MLSRHDRHELDKIEHWFETTDPELAEMLRSAKPSSSRWLTALAIALGAAALVLPVVGVLTSTVPLVLYAVPAAGGAIWAYAARRRR